MLVHLPLSPTMPSAVFAPAQAWQTPGTTTPVSVDLDARMRAHLARVFRGRDAGRRLGALDELHTQEPPSSSLVWR